MKKIILILGICILIVFVGCSNQFQDCIMYDKYDLKIRIMEGDYSEGQFPTGMVFIKDLRDNTTIKKMVMSSKDGKFTSMHSTICSLSEKGYEVWIEGEEENKIIINKGDYTYDPVEITIKTEKKEDIIYSFELNYTISNISHNISNWSLNFS